MADFYELVENELAGEPQQKLFVFGELLSTARVGPQLDEQADLIHPDRAVRQMISHLGQVGEHLRHLHLKRRRPPRRVPHRPDPLSDRPETILAEHLGAFALADHRRFGDRQPADLGIQPA